MPSRKDAESRASTKRRDVEQTVLLDSPALVTPLLTSAKDPPPYGAQHRQDALWKGGNKALPPLWHQLMVLDGEMGYQDDTLIMISLNRPLPGVRLDLPGSLIPRCEWHISPLGQSYFVNHNTRTTSWKKLTPERPAGSLSPECIIGAHSKCIRSLACVISCNIMSASDDGSIRQWTRDGEQVGEPWDSDGGGVNAIAVCPDETMVVAGNTDGGLRLWDVRKGSMVGDPWEGHEDVVRCLDWCSNALEITSGSEDGTIRQWNPDTGRQIAPPIQTGHRWVLAVRYSARGDKFASCGADNMIRVWSNHGELLIEINGHDSWVDSLCWSKDGAYIFSASYDGTVRKWKSINGEEFVVLRGHTNTVSSFCLSPDECYLVSASDDYSVRIWDLKTNRLVGEPLLHDDSLDSLTVSPDGKYIASAGRDAKIYAWNLEVVLKQHCVNKVASAHVSNTEPDAKLKGRAALSRDIFDARLVSKQQPNSRGLTRYGDDFWGDGANRTPRRSADTSSPLRWRNLFGFLHFSTRPANELLHQPRRLNAGLFPVGKYRRPVDVAPARDEDRYGIAPESDAEAAAAMQRTSGNNADSSTAQGQAIAQAQGSQGQPMQTHDLASGTGETSYEVSCCGFVVSARRRGRP